MFLCLEICALFYVQKKTNFMQQQAIKRRQEKSTRMQKNIKLGTDIGEQHPAMRWILNDY